MYKLITSSICILACILQITANELSDGYKSFIQNDLKLAFQHFSAATNSDETKAEAYLMLSLLSTVDKNNDVAFHYFSEFYNCSKNPEPYAIALFHHKCAIGYQNLKSTEQLNWLLNLLNQPKLNTTLKGYIYESLSSYYATLRDFKKSSEYLSKIGAVTDWQITGQFDNTSASGFDKVYAPINQPEPESVFKNSLNAEIKWFDLHNQVPGKWIDLTNNFICNNSLIYAQTFCNSPADQTVFLRIGTSGSLKLWVNDQLLFTEDEERNNGLDTYIVPVKLNRGNNRILLQIGISTITRCNFLMIVTDKVGNFNSDLTFSTLYKPYSKTIQEQPSLITSFSESFLLNQISENPDKLVNYLVLANAYLSNDKKQNALGILEKAQNIAPNCSFLLNQFLELYYRDNKKTSISLIQEKLKKNDPNNPDVINCIINDDFDTENYKDARLYIDKKEQLFGKTADWYLYKIKLANAENKAEEYANLINETYNKFPNDYKFVSVKFQFENEVKQNPNLAIKILREYLKKYYNVDALKALSKLYLKLGKKKEGTEILKDLAKNAPNDDLYYKQLGELYLQERNYNLAREYFKKCIEIAPYYGPYHGYYAKASEETGDAVNAEFEYKLNVNYKPDDYDAIKELRKLQNKKEIFDLFPEKDYYKLFDNSPTLENYPSENIIGLTDENQLVLYKNGGCVTRRIYMFKALTLKGIDYLKEYKIAAPIDNLIIEKAEILKKNGNRLQAEINDNHIVYTSLEPGDAVFLIYKVYKDVSDPISMHFYESVLFNTWYASLNIEYNVLVEKGVKFDYKIVHSNIKPEEVILDDFKWFSWKKTNSKPIKYESYMPTLVDVVEILSISTFPDWNFISKWYNDISNTKAKPDHEVIETVNALLKDKTNLTEYQKASIFYNYIEQNIRYSSVSFRQSGTVPQKASDVLITRIGDCKDLSILFTSMCRVAGINAEILLVLRRLNGSNWINLPNFNFDHAISKTILDGKEYYIELTSSYLPFAALGDSHIKSMILPVNGDTSFKAFPVLLTTNNRQPNNITLNSKVYFNGDNMTSNISTVKTGIMAEYTRSAYKDIDTEEREKKFNKSITDNYSNTKLLSLNFNSTLKDCSDTLTYNYSFVSPKVFTKINNLSIVKLPLMEKITPMDFLSLEKRQYPIEAWKYTTIDTLVENLNIVIPENTNLAEVPKSVHYSCNQADYSLTFMVLKNELKINRTISYKSDEVPVSEYTDYRNFIEKVVSADSQQIGFRQK